MTTIDLAPLVNSVLVPLLTPVLLAVGAWALSRIATYAHFQVQDGQRQVVAAAITNGVAYAQQHAAAYEQLSVNDKAAAVVNYVLPKVPGALKALNVTPEHLADVVKARLPAS